MFDKTGTLTRGEPSVTDVLVVEAGSPLNLQPDAVMRFAASAEKNSEHPLGEAIVRGAQVRGVEILDPERFESIPG
ncbi:MAG: HAD family hydrolase, partial [Chloroflexota bacterium]